MPNHPARKQTGFTLIEFLIVIAMVGIMSAVAVVSIKPQKFFNAGNDARRKNDLRELQNSLQSYYLDKGNYPLTSPSLWQIANGIPGLSPTYIKSIPSDPSSGNSCPGYLYEVSSDGSRYNLFASLKEDDDPDAQKVKPNPNIPVNNICGTPDGFKTCVIVSGTCSNSQYNYWVSNP